MVVGVKDITRVYGEDNLEFEFTYEGFRNDDTAEDLQILPEAMTSATVKSDVGTYEIFVHGGKADNYTFTAYNSGSLQINKAEQEIEWNMEVTEVTKGDLLELTAMASSGLKVSYEVSDTSVAVIKHQNGKTYLDCKETGNVTITAWQDGDKNYNGSPVLSKSIVVMNSTNIDEINMTDENIVGIYDLNGRIVSKNSKGVKIIRYSNGQTRKVYVK